MKAAESSAQNSSLLLVEKKSHFEIVLNRPKYKNAVDLTMAKALQAALKDLEKRSASTELKVLVVRSSIPNLFCAGGDLKAYEKMKSKAEGVKVNRLMTQNLKALSALPYYSIAFVEGLCVGGGCEIALACDALWTSHSAEFVFGQSRVGLTPGWGGAARLVERVGVSKAKFFLLTAQKIFSAEARLVGLTDVVVEDFDRELKALVAVLPDNRELLSAVKNVAQNPDSELAQFEKLWWSPTHRENLKKFVGQKK